MADTSKKMDWRDNGEQLTRLFQLAAVGTLANANLDFIHAITGLNKNPSSLVGYLRSRRDIGPVEREIIATSIERVAQGNKNGRPPDLFCPDAGLGRMCVQRGVGLLKCETGDFRPWAPPRNERSDGPIRGQGRMQHARQGVV